MKISVGSDHRGIELRLATVELLKQSAHEVIDRGTDSVEGCDYPDVAKQVTRDVAEATADRGILYCGSGIGMSIAANKTCGIRAALCHDQKSAEMSRRHNDANVLCLSADQLTTLGGDQLTDLIKTWLATDFEGGRHKRRVDKIAELETERCHESG